MVQLYYTQVKLPYETSCPSVGCLVGRSVCTTKKGRKVTLQMLLSEHLFFLLINVVYIKYIRRESRTIAS